eukprot:10903825-Prorocentrum_lima.AAC.1
MITISITSTGISVTTGIIIVTTCFLSSVWANPHGCFRPGLQQAASTQEFSAGLPKRSARSAGATIN